MIQNSLTGKQQDWENRLPFGISVIQPIVQGKVSIPLIALFLVGVIGFLVAGTMLIEKGAEDD